jgi:hypothetical protein
MKGRRIISASESSKGWLGDFRDVEIEFIPAGGTMKVRWRVEEYELQRQYEAMVAGGIAPAALDTLLGLKEDLDRINAEENESEY